jgi:hypothetical protein
MFNNSLHHMSQKSMKRTQMQPISFEGFSIVVSLKSGVKHSIVWEI